jgi:hypothetical protein
MSNAPALPLSPIDSALLDRVGTFYHSAFNDVLTDALGVLGICFATVGIILPIIITILQNRSFHKERQAIEASFKAKFDELHNRLKEAFSKELEDQKKLFKEELNQLNHIQHSHTEALALFLQARIHATEKNYHQSALSYVRSAKFFLDANDAPRSELALKALTHCLELIDNNERLKLPKEKIFKEHFDAIVSREGSAKTFELLSTIHELLKAPAAQS